MNLTNIEKCINEIADEAPFILHIRNKQEYAKAINLLEQLIEDYQRHERLIHILGVSIERYENEAPQFDEFNAKLKTLDSGVAVLATLMDQHGLGVADFPNEIGSKGVVSMILNHKRKLNLRHIRGLAKRFNLLEQVFI